MIIGYQLGITETGILHLLQRTSTDTFVNFNFKELQSFQ